MAVSSLFVVPTAAAQQQPAPPPPCSAPEYRQFDFWIGEWRVETPDRKLAGTNRISSIYGGCALEERWTGARGMSGASFNIYDRASGTWHQTWVDSNGLLLRLDGRFENGAMRLSGKRRAGENEILERITWSRLEPADGKLRVRQLWEQSTDAGKSWTTSFDGTYIRQN